MQGEVHTGKTITDLSELVERAEAKAGCYGSSEPSADDPIAEELPDSRGAEAAVGEAAEESQDSRGAEAPADDPVAEKSQDSCGASTPAWAKPAQSGDPGEAAVGEAAEEFQDSCGAEAAVGKASDGACVEGLGEEHGTKDGDPSAMSSRSESQQNCAGLGAEWGIPPAGIQFGAAADGAPFVAPSFAPYPGSSAAPKLLGRGMEALILAQSCVLLSRALAYVGLADLHCARSLAVEIRDHLDAINCYALAKGIGLELAEAQLNLMSVTGDFAVSDVTA